MPTKTIRVDVTDDLIALAIRGNSSHCMISDAIKVAIPQAMRISTDLQTIRFTMPDGIRYIHFTPQRCQQVLVDFDKGKEIPPFSFGLSRAVQRVKSGHRAKGEAKMLPKRKMIDQTERDARQGLIPPVAGGRTPPVAALAHNPHAGRRRTYGLRLGER